MTDPLAPNFSRKRLLNKSVHTSGGLHIGNIHNMDGKFLVVRREMITTIYYRIPIQKIREWDGHAVWLSIDEKESERHIFTTYEREGFNVENIFLELDLDFLEKTSYQAEGRGITITSYIDQIINKYLEQDRFKPKAGTVMLSAPVVKELSDNLTIEEILFTAKSTAKNVLENNPLKVTIEGKRLDLNFILSWLEDHMNNYAFELRHIVSKAEDEDSYCSLSDGNTTRHTGFEHHKFILKHTAGQNYSLYCKTVFDLIFDQLLQKRVIVSTSANTITCELEE